MPPVQLDGFLAALAELSTDDLDRVARALDAETIADEVDWWRATIAIDRAIRHARRTRQAARAATRATELVVRCGRWPWADRPRGGAGGARRGRRGAWSRSGSGDGTDRPAPPRAVGGRHGAGAALLAGPCSILSAATPAPGRPGRSVGCGP